MKPWKLYFFSAWKLSRYSCLLTYMVCWIDLMLHVVEISIQRTYWLLFHKLLSQVGCVENHVQLNRWSNTPPQPSGLLHLLHFYPTQNIYDSDHPRTDLSLKLLELKVLQCRDAVVGHIPDLSARCCFPVSPQSSLLEDCSVDLTGSFLCPIIKGLLSVLKMALRPNLGTGVRLTINTYLGRRSCLIWWLSFYECSQLVW